MNGDEHGIPLLVTLREGTEGLHRRLEGRLGLPDSLTAPGDYPRLLARLHGFYAPLEARLVAAWPGEWGRLGLGPERFDKAARLEADLRSHGYGAETGVRWQEFRRATEEYPRREAAEGRGDLTRDDALCGARQTFRALESWLLAPEPPA